MHTFFAPASLAVYGLSSKAQNTPRIIVETCLRWGFQGRLFGVMPGELDALGSFGAKLVSVFSDPTRPGRSRLRQPVPRRSPLR